MTDDEIVIARAKMLDELGNEEKVDSDDGVKNTVKSSLADDCEVSLLPHAPTVASASGSQAPFAPQFGVGIRSPATPTVVDDSMTRAPFTPKSAFELACERAAL